MFGAVSFSSPPKKRISVGRGVIWLGHFVVPGSVPLEGMSFSKDSVFRHLFLGDFSHITGKSSSERFELKWHRFLVLCRGCSYHSQNALRYRGMKERDTGF